MNHHPEWAENIRRFQELASRTAARQRSERALLRAESVLYSIDEWALADRSSIQAILDAVIRLELAGRLPNARTRNLLRALAIAVRNFDTPPIDTGQSRTYRHNLNRYHHARRSLDQRLEALCQEAEARDQSRRE